MTAYWEQIPARPTTYRGIEMRSRLEARFAEYLDEEGWHWTYEPRVYAGRSGQYLPDFLIDEGLRRCFVEVKPTAETAEAALIRMAVILESEPDAALLAVYPEDDLWLAKAP